MWRWAGGLAAAIAAAVPGTASAAEISTRTVCTGFRSCDPVVEVVYTAAPGEANALSVDFEDGVFVYRDRVPIAVGKRCVRRSETEAACRGYAGLADTRDGADVVRAQGVVPYTGYGSIHVDAGPADDRVQVSGASADGGEGNDELTGDRLAGGAGNDTLTAGAAGAQLAGGTGDDVLRGGPGDDHLMGDLGPPPRGGDDFVPGADVLEGGDGADTVSYWGHTADVSVDLTAQTGGAAGEGDVLSGFEHAVGGRGDDRLVGDAGPNRLDGGRGRNTVLGGGGDDDVRAVGGSVLDGGDGDDQVSGGPEDDDLRGGTGDDELSDYYSGLDRWSGGEGDDRLDVSVGVVGERIGCGAGDDVVLLPRLALVLPDCERVGPLAAYPRRRRGGRLAFTIPRASRYRGGRIELRIRGRRRPFATRALTRRRGAARAVLRVPPRIRARRRDPLPVQVRIYDAKQLRRSWVFALPR